MGDGIVDTLDSIAGVASLRPQKSQGHNSDVGGHPDDSHIVVCGSDGPGHMSAVSTLILRVSVIGEGVDSVNIVHPSVAVVVESVVGNFFRVDPHVVSEVGVRIVYPRIDNTDDDLRATKGFCPGSRGRNVGPRGAPCLTQVSQPPEVVESWVVGEEFALIGLDPIVRLHVFHLVQGLQRGHRFFHTVLRVDGHLFHPVGQILLESQSNIGLFGKFGNISSAETTPTNSRCGAHLNQNGILGESSVRWNRRGDFNTLTGQSGRLHP